eukprot:12038517-Alexandrium_andersonii.AAC.1
MLTCVAAGVARDAARGQAHVRPWHRTQPSVLGRGAPRALRAGACKQLRTVCAVRLGMVNVVDAREAGGGGWTGACGAALWRVYSKLSLIHI